MNVIVLRILLVFVFMGIDQNIFAQSINTINTKYFGRLWNSGQASASIISQDGGSSNSVPGGTLWWFGDTFKGTRDETGKPIFSGKAVSCCTAFLREKDNPVPPVLNYLKGNDGSVEQAIQFLPDESWDHNRIWPLAGAYINGKSYIFYTLVEITGLGEWDFKHTGSGLAYSTVPLGIHKRILYNENWHFPVSPSAIVETKEWIYMYEVGKKRDVQGIWLSRVEPGQIENPGAYQFYCGNGKFNNDEKMQVIFMKNIYGQVSVNWNEYLKQYILLSSSDFSHPLEIRLFTSPVPTGPFNRADASVKVPGFLQGKPVNLVYCSFLHPELNRENGRILNITFSLNLKDAGFDANIEMIEIELNK